MAAVVASGDALRLLLRVCEWQPPEVTRQWVGLCDAEAAFETLTELGVLRHTGNAGVIRCLACDETHDVAVEMTATGRLRAYCPDAG